MVQRTQDYALYFDGSGDYVEIEDDSSLRPDKYTLEVWVKTDGVPEDDACILGKGDGYSIWVNNVGGISHRYRTTHAENIHSDIPGGVVFPDKWHHIAVTNDGITARTYVDGDLKKEDSVEGTIQSLRDTLLRFAVDPKEDYPTNPAYAKSIFKGHLSEIRLWDRALDQDAIQSNMLNRLVGDEESLVGYWPLNNIDNNVVADLSKSEMYGKVYGARLEESLPSLSPTEAEPYSRQYALSFDQFPSGTQAKIPPVKIENVPAFTNGITVSYWAKNPLLAPNQHLWQYHALSPFILRWTKGDVKGGLNDSPWVMVGGQNPGVASAYLEFRINGLNGAKYSFSKDFTCSKWHHYAGTYDRSSIRLYVDGEEVVSKQYTEPIADDASPIQLGYFYYTNGFIGDMAQVQLWDHALSGEKIRDSMFKDLEGTETGLVGYWPFNEGSGLISYDKTPNSHYAAISTTVRWNEQMPIGIVPSDGGTGPGTGGGPDSGIGGSTESGKTYQIQTPSGLLLTVLGNVGYDSADVQGGSSQGTNGQKWTITEEGILKSGLGDFALDMVPVGDDTKQSVQIKALDPNSPTQKWELTSEGLLRNKSNGFVVVMMEYTSYPGSYFVDAFAPEKLSEFPYWILFGIIRLYEYTWQFNEV